MMYEDVIPTKFFAAIKEKSLFENKQLMVEFEQWCRVEMASLQTKSNAIYAIRPLIAEKFDASAREVFQQSFHDGAFLRTEQVGDDFIMLLDLSGGFTLQTITVKKICRKQLASSIFSFYFEPILSRINA